MLLEYFKLGLKVLAAVILQRLQHVDEAIAHELIPQVDPEVAVIIIIDIIIIIIIIVIITTIIIITITIIKIPIIKIPIIIITIILIHRHLKSRSSGLEMRALMRVRHATRRGSLFRISNPEKKTINSRRAFEGVSL